jgi:membrane protease YdiL (CAAX protease family)
MHWDYTIILAFLAAVLPLMGKWRVERILRRPGMRRTERLRLYASTITFQWLLVAVILWRTRVRGVSVAALGLALPRPGLAIAVSIGLVALVLANQLVSLRFVGSRPEELRGKLAEVALRIFPQDHVERLTFFGVVSTVAICEELIYRGFVQTIFERALRTGVAGVVISAVMFSFAHLYQGKRGLIATLVVGVVFSIARFYTASLLPSIAAHFVVDLIAGYMFPRRLREALAREHPSVVDSGH